MQAGNRHLQIWLKDQLRQGLASLQAQPPQYWEEFASLMVDSKLGAIARRILRIKENLSAQRDFEVLIDEIAELYLFSSAFPKIDRLPDQMQQDLLQMGGANLRKEDVLAADGLSDYWLVVGVGEYLEEKLRVRRTWLLGEKTGRFALILDFAWGNRSFETNYKMGTAFDAEVVFYPGQVPLRGLIRNSKYEARPFNTPSGIQGFGELSENFSTLLAKNPWLKTYPYLLVDVIPRPDGNGFELVDRNGMALELKTEGHLSAWKLVSLSGFDPVDVFGEWDGYGFRAYTVFVAGRLVVL